MASAQVDQPVGAVLAGEGIAARTIPGLRLGLSVGVEGLRQAQRARAVHQLAHTAQGISQEVLHAAIDLRQPPRAIDVGGRAVAEGLGQPLVEVHLEGHRHTVDRLAQAVAQSVIGVDRHNTSRVELGQAVGGVVGIAVDAIVEQVAIGIPGVIDAICIGQAIGGLVGIAVAAQVGLLAQAVAIGVGGLVVVRAAGIVRGGQAVERVVGVVDHDRVFDLQRADQRVRPGAG